MSGPHYADDLVTLYLGDCLDVLREMEADSVDAIVTDPPAGIAFMDREWDDFRRARNPADAGRDNVFGRTSARGPEYGRRDRRQFVDWLTERMTEAYRVLKPGGHALVWSIPRTSHWTAWALEDAGFDIRDCVLHLFGCLSEDTEILVNGQWEPYRNVKSGSLVLAYNPERDEFAWEPVEEVYVYPDYSDTAFRIRGDHTDQLVSREHRCLIERGGAYVFERAEEAARQREARVPVLEDVPSLLAALPVPDEGTGRPQPDMLESLRRSAVSGSEARTAQSPAESSPDLPGVQQALPATSGQAARPAGTGVLAAVQGNPGRGSAANAGRERAQRLDRGVDGVVCGEDDGTGEPCLEGRRDLLPQEGELRAGQVRPLPASVRGDGPQGRLRDGAPAPGGAGDRPLPPAGGSSPSRQPRSAGQPAGEPDAVRDQPRPQAVRASRFTRSDLARIEPVEYSGLVWCVRVPSGAFVARRNGKVFVTGNSGFPKSLDVSKAIDRAAGAEREVVGPGMRHASRAFGAAVGDADYSGGAFAGGIPPVTAPATEDAARWEGWGTALKPGQEIWWLVRKPLAGTVAANVLEYGTSALNIAACMVAHASPADLAESQAKNPGRADKVTSGTYGADRPQQSVNDAGRWPTNIVLTHSAACEPIGLREVRSDGHHPASRGPGGLGTSGHSGQDDLSERKSGAERVEAWSCAADCPVAELDRQSGVTTSTGGVKGGHLGNGTTYGRFEDKVRANAGGLGDTGGASRFYPTFRYQAKAPASERPRLEDGTAHETVKPLGLISWMLRLIVPPGGTVLDMFAGSGPVGEACVVAGIPCILIEQDAKSAELIMTRLRKPIQPDLFGGAA